MDQLVSKSPLARDQLAAESRELLSALDVSVRRSQSLVRTGRSLLTHSEPDPFEVGAFWREVLNALETLHTLTLTASTLSERSEEAARLALLSLDAELRDACAEKGWTVEGQWPTLYVNKAIRIDINETRRTATVSDRRIRQVTLSRLMAALSEAVPGLLSHKQSPAEFIALMARAYDEVAGPNGGPVPIWEVYRAIIVHSQSARFWRDARVEQFDQISADQFRARITNALERGATRTTDGRELRLLPPLDPKDALFVYQPAENRFGYVGRIEFMDSREVSQ